MTEAPTERELEHLHKQMRLIRDFVHQEKTGSAHHCVYCGTPCFGRACRQHGDLVQIESRPVT